MKHPLALKYLIGFDCGKKTGVAVWEVDYQQFSAIKTVDFWKAYNWVSTSFNAAETIIYIEDPSQNRPVWRREGMKEHEYQKKCQDVGAVKRESLLMIEGLQRQEFEVKAIQPNKGSFTKLTAAAFKKITKYTKRTSEHSRDAAMLVFQRRLNGRKSN